MPDIGSIGFSWERDCVQHEPRNHFRLPEGGQQCHLETSTARDTWPLQEEKMKTHGSGANYCADVLKRRLNFRERVHQRGECVRLIVYTRRPSHGALARNMAWLRITLVCGTMALIYSARSRHGWVVGARLLLRAYASMSAVCNGGTSRMLRFVSSAISPKMFCRLPAFLGLCAPATFS